jgi:hypothetical protein
MSKDILVEIIRDFYPFAKKKMGFNKPVRIFLVKDLENSLDPMGRTASYNPSNGKIKLFYLNRHPKDVLRSLAHELTHHKQYCEGRLVHESDDILEDRGLYLLELEANGGGVVLREFEEQCKKRGIHYIGYMDQDLASTEGEWMPQVPSVVSNLQEKKKKKTKFKRKVNPWAVCTKKVGREDEDKYESCVMGVKKSAGIKKESLQESKVSENSDFDRSLEDTSESDTVKDHYARRAERVFDKLTEKHKKKQEGGDK